LKVTGTQATVTGAGRTDTGVHATGQVIAFDVVWKHGEEALLSALNAALPDDIALQGLTQQAGFHPRYHAATRIYSYTIIQAAQRQPLWLGRSWRAGRPLNGEALAQAAALLVGTHDFGTFGDPSKGDNTVRTVFRSEWAVEDAAFGRVWMYTIEANGFLKHMVRRIVALMMRVGRGVMTVDEFEATFRRAELLGGVRLAPPEGLVLVEVTYPQR
jgi:tRNA pseudouridine38-40 synthase